MSGIGDHSVRVAVVGAGPAGIGTAVGLAKRGGGPVLLLERWDEAGGVPAKYRSGPGALATYIDYARARVLVGQRFSEGLLARLARTDVELRLESTVIGLDVEHRQLTVVDPHQGKHAIRADAIVLAVGAREENVTERGWIAGSRSGRVFFTMQLLQLLHCQRQLGWKDTAVVGSDVIAYLAAAELKTAGAQRVQMFDALAKPETPWLQRWYFRRWVNPRWEPASSLVLTSGKEGEQGVKLAGGRRVSCDALVVSGRLVPNAELLIEAGLEVQTSTGVPRVSRGGRLASPGWFVAGNAIGGFHGGQWAYYHGLRVAKNVARYLHDSASLDR
jgi:NADPH-dependent 2,4-dienoyl-CoA reductase/sulfur reductase-like enzyme